MPLVADSRVPIDLPTLHSTAKSLHSFDLNSTAAAGVVAVEYDSASATWIVN